VCRDNSSSPQARDAVSSLRPANRFLPRHPMPPGLGAPHQPLPLSRFLQV
jgi:hypothetical protein